MAGISSAFSHDTLNLPVAGSSSDSISLPEIDIWSDLATQNSVESSSYNHVYCDSSDLLSTSPDMRYVARPSMQWTDLSDSYLFLELQLIKTSGKDRTITDADKTCVSNFLSNSIFKDLQVSTSKKWLTFAGRSGGE